MKTGKSLEDLLIELKRQSQAKKDIVADTRQIVMASDADCLSVGSHVFESINDTAHNQIGTYLNIPKKYYELMRSDQPELLAHNVNTWLHLESNTQKRLVRTLDGTARAFLSDRYRRIDNDVIAQMALTTLFSMPQVSGANVVSCEITPTRLYIKVVFFHIQGEVKVGDIVESGIMITNSEIGLGGFTVKPFIHRLWCKNGAVMNDAVIAKRHIGSRLASGVINYQDDTKKADDQALMLEMRDTIMTCGDQDSFNVYLERMRESTESEKIQKPVEAVEVLTNDFSVFTFSEGEKNLILENLIRDQDYSKWGMLNAVTKVANDHPDYERATELEGYGGTILSLDRSQWSLIANAA